jgi:hypothetical protein
MHAHRIALQESHAGPLRGAVEGFIVPRMVGNDPVRQVAVTPADLYHRSCGWGWLAIKWGGSESDAIDFLNSTREHPAHPLNMCKG